MINKEQLEEYLVSQGLRLFIAEFDNQISRHNNYGIQTGAMKRLMTLPQTERRTYSKQAKTLGYWYTTTTKTLFTNGKHTDSLLEIQKKLYNISQISGIAIKTLLDTQPEPHYRSNELGMASTSIKSISDSELSSGQLDQNKVLIAVFKPTAVNYRGKQLAYAGVVDQMEYNQASLWLDTQFETHSKTLEADKAQIDNLFEGHRNVEFDITGTKFIDSLTKRRYTSLEELTHQRVQDAHEEKLSRQEIEKQIKQDLENYKINKQIELVELKRVMKNKRAVRKAQMQQKGI